MLTLRQKQVAALVGLGMSRKEIAKELGIASPTVKRHIVLAAARLPGDTTPRHKLMLWFFTTQDVVGPFG